MLQNIAALPGTWPKPAGSYWVKGLDKVRRLHRMSSYHVPQGMNMPECKRAQSGMRVNTVACQGSFLVCSSVG